MRFTFALFVYLVAAAVAAAAPERVPCAVEDASAMGSTVWLLCERDVLYSSDDNGGAWRSERLPADVRFRAVAVLDPRRGFVAGDAGTLLATVDAGSSWRRVPVPTKEHLTSLFFLGELGWATGWGGVVLHSADSGRSWKLQQTGTPQSLEHVFFADPSHGWAVGWAGTILRTVDGGNKWQLARAGAMLGSLNAVYFSDNRTGWIVGFGGQILKSTDGGATWAVKTSGSNATLTSVIVDPKGNGWIAGGGELLFTTDGGERWQAVRPAERIFLHTLANTRSTIWAVGQHRVFRKDGQSAEWQPVELGLDGLSEPASTF